MQVVAQPKFNDKGRPAKDKQPDFYIYRLESSIASLCSERTRRLERKSCFILATNQLDCKELSDSDLIVVYKDQ